MDERYLTQLFGRNKGYVAVASKAGEGKADWTEQSFLWPNDRAELVAWVNDRRNTDLFICPALRRNKGRRKNDAAHLQWLWADVDFQDIDERHHAKIRARVQRLGNWVVWSGSGENCHVYVRLDRVVHIDVWRRLNLGLRQALMADAKHTDNALLRIPGTQNYKPGGKAVVMEEGRGVVRVPARLLKAKPWRDVVVTETGANDGTWEKVELPPIPGGVKARVSMDVDEGVGRYGNRHQAVYQVAAWLSKRGYTSDEIHTLMADFKPGISKQNDERGYDLHDDISRCLAQHPTREDVAPELAEDEEYFEEVGPATEDETLKKLAERKLKDRKASRIADQLFAQENFLPPPDSVSYSAAEARLIKREPVVFTVDGMAKRGHNVTITGQYKTGKTMLAMNLLRSLCDHTPFLDDRKVRALDDDENVGFWSMEMNEVDLFDDYVFPQEMENEDRLKVLNGRGWGVNLLTEVGMIWAVNWLKTRNVGVWLIDSWARICRTAGVDENDNAAVGDLTYRLDEIKTAAGVTDLFILAHTGRMMQEEGRERARGAATFDDWADSRWIFTSDGDTRFLALDKGRGIDPMVATSLTFNPETKRMTLSGQDRVDTRLAAGCQLVTTIVAGSPPRHYTKTALVKVFKERAPERHRSNTAATEAIREAVDTGFVREVDGGRNKKVYELTPTKSELGPATPKDIDFTRVLDRPRGKRLRE